MTFKDIAILLGIILGILAVIWVPILTFQAINYEYDAYRQRIITDFPKFENECNGGLSTPDDEIRACMQRKGMKIDHKKQIPCTQKYFRTKMVELCLKQRKEAKIRREKK
jgi:hypothetical protein